LLLDLLERYLNSLLIDTTASYKTIKVKVQDLPVRVNGDDILFRSNEHHYAIWKSVIKEVGFELSLGKNYIHPRLLTVNSIMYEYTNQHGFEITDKSELARTGDKFKEVSYFNTGLLMAQSKSTMREKTRKLPLSDLYKIVVGGAINKARAHRRFIHYNLEQINLMTQNGKYNLFAPIVLGGLGFHVFDEVREAGLIQLTNFQRRFATFIDIKVNEQLIEGKDPSKYLFALVEVDSKPLNTIIKHKYGVTVPIKKVPFGPLEFGQVPILSPDMINPLFGSDLIIGSELKYRLPSKTLTKEFSSFEYSDPLASAERRQMSDGEILDMEGFYLVRQEYEVTPALGSSVPDEGVFSVSPKNTLDL